MYRLNQIKVDACDWNKDIKAVLLEKTVRLVRVKKEDISDFEIVKESIDARDKTRVRKIYSVNFNCRRKLNTKAVKNLELEKRVPYSPVDCGDEILKERPVVIGMGPCGMFAALILAEAGYSPLVLERGKCVEDRIKDVEKFWDKGILDEESNVQFGEGGAGTFSDGKLTTGIRDFRIGKVLGEFVEAGAQPEILYHQKPHIGSDVLITVVRNMRKKIESLGGEIRFGSKVTDIRIEDCALTSITVNGTEEIPAKAAVFAIGHSARDTFRMLYSKGMTINQKPFSIGVRIEHDQKLIDENRYGEFASQLDPADYKLSYHTSGGRGVYTFCMCPGGVVIPAASQAGGVVTNGMSYSRRDSGKANSALLVDVKTDDFASDHPLAGIDFQEKYERAAFANSPGGYKPPQTSWGALRDELAEAEPVKACLPAFVPDAYREAMPFFGSRISGFDDDGVLMRAVETRSSSPVRLVRGEDGNSSFKGLYPAGEGAGYAGGITSAAVDGIRIAEKIIGKYSNEMIKNKEFG